jgi:cyclopropane fatty-acyl-phospholipid synthase-like methyltransferase
MERERFESAYEGQPPWDIPGPQPPLARLEAAGMIRGAVLDAGCGTGENALYLASRGHEVWGLDFIPVAIERAKAKAKERGLNVHFQVGNALKLDQLGRTFDTVIDCGLFHTFTDEERPLYVSGLATVVGPGGSVLILCFSDQEPPGQGPRRVTQEVIRDAFRHGWEVIEIEEARFETSDHPEARTFSPGGPKAWLATITRTSASR